MAATTATASIAVTTGILTASAVSGTILPGAVVSGTGITGGIEAASALTAGSGYTGNGGAHTYTTVPLTGGTGSGAQATVVVAGSVVTSVTITAAGTNYSPGDSLSASNANLGGAGSGFATGIILQPVAVPVVIKAYGTGSTTGTGGNGTYATNITTAVASATLTFTDWVPPPIPPDPLPQYTFGGVALVFSNTVVIAPPPPLPETLFGSTTQTSYST